MAEAKMELVDWLDDLTVRFLLNLPPSELSSVPRLCFQVEEAQWYYEDFVRPLAAASGRPLPSLQLRQFMLQLFQHSQLFSAFDGDQHMAAYEEFLAYKVRVPVRGAILLDESMEQVVLVRGWKKGSNWSFPRGKINKDERDLDCAIREVYEETGFDARAAGVVPEIEQDAKYIDMTMREQHMRMFVFRDVSLDTYFEPKTRKEISKIEWYNLRELPGWTKKKHHENVAGHANKFYMVAPFLGQLKKWIIQQRQKDAEALQAQDLSTQAHPSELETETEENMTDTAAVPDRSEDLKRLLNIGSLAQLTQAPPPPPTVPGNQASNLLAILQGQQGDRTGQLPQTPLEQVTAFPQQPQSPHPHHPRQPSLGMQPPPPQFPFSPPRAQQQQNAPLPPPGYFGPPGMSFGPNGLPPQLQQQQFHPQHPGMSGQHLGQPFVHGNGMAFNQGAPMPMHMPFAPPQPQPPMPQRQQGNFSQQQPSIITQGQQGAIAAGPAVPKASQLPAPKLNAQSMKLLEAFKLGNKPTAAGTGTAGSSPRAGNPHQAALLGLFRAPAAPTTSKPASSAKAEETVSPTLAEPSMRPPVSQVRRPTMNEITRTLPMKQRQPSQPSQPSPAVSEAQRLATAVSTPPSRSARAPASSADQSIEQPKLRQNADSSVPQPPGMVPLTILQRQASGNAIKTPRSRQPAPSKAPVRPAAKARVSENGAPTVPFTILTRNGAAKGAADASTAPPANGVKQDSAPHVLKRPEIETTAAPPILSIVQTGNGPAGGDKSDRLLALFGKPSPAVSPLATPSATTHITSPVSPPTGSITSPEPTNKKNLLDIFTASAPRQSSAAQATPPTAPQLLAERKPSRAGTAPQTALLDLFKKPTVATSSSRVGSPETPISPFMLGSPNVARHPGGGLGIGPAHGMEQPRSRLNSATSAGSASGVLPGVGGGPAATTGNSTPTEAKDFLLGYLNGVVQKEGRRGGGR